MKNTTLLFIFITAVSHLAAQYTLTPQNSNPKAGQVFYQNVEENVSGFNPGPSGASVNWDFSGFNASDTAVIQIKVANNNDYPFADIFFTQAGADAYFATNSSNFRFFGFDAPQITVVYTDPEDQIRYPFTFGDSFTDTKSGNSAGFGQTAQRSGNVEVSADAHGTLITPYETLNNTLRLKIVRNDTDYFLGSAINISTDTVYYWYANKYNFPVMSYIRLYQNGSLAYSSVNYLQDQPVGLEKSSLSNLVLYPNPSKSFVEVQGLENQETVIKLFNLAGLQVDEIRNSSAFSIQHLPIGIYMVQIEAENEVLRTMKLVKE